MCYNSSTDTMKKLLVRADLSWYWENSPTEGQERHILAGIVGIGRQIPDSFAWIFGRQVQGVQGVRHQQYFLIMSLRLLYAAIFGNLQQNVRWLDRQHHSKEWLCLNDMIPKDSNNIIIHEL